MKAFADLIPQLVWALSVAAHVYLVLEHATSKGKVVSEAIGNAGQDSNLNQANTAALSTLQGAAEQTAANNAAGLGGIAIGVATSAGGSGGAGTWGSTLAPPAPPPAAPAPAVHPIVQAVVTGVQATTPPENWATTAANVLQGLMPIIQPAEQIGRASTRTQGEVAIGVAALSVLLQAFFPHPGA